METTYPNYVWDISSNPTLPYSSDLSINNMGQISGKPDWSAGGTGSIDYTITVRIDDPYGGQSDVSFVLRVNNVDPVISSIADITRLELQNIDYDISLSDETTGNYTWSISSTLPCLSSDFLDISALSNVDGKTGAKIIGKPDQTAGGSNSVNYIVKILM